MIIRILFLTKRDVKKTCYLIVTSDRGLAGAYNANTFKALEQTLETHSSKDEFIVTSIGRKGFSYIEQKGYPTIDHEPEVNALYELGFRGADLLTACFGQAVSEFGKYETVEKADGSEVTVGELLELAKLSAFNALLRGFEGLDEYTRFYIGWLQMNGMGDTDFDDAAKFARVGMSVNISDIFDKHLLIRTGNKQHLATYKERVVKTNSV